MPFDDWVRASPRGHHRSGVACQHQERQSSFSRFKNETGRGTGDLRAAVAADGEGAHPSRSRGTASERRATHVSGDSGESGIGEGLYARGGSVAAGNSRGGGGGLGGATAFAWGDFGVGYRH